MKTKIEELLNKSRKLEQLIDSLNDLSGYLYCDDLSMMEINYLDPDEIMQQFREEYLERKEPYHFRKLRVDDLSDETTSEFDTRVVVAYTDHGVEKRLEAVGNGPIDAVKRGLQEVIGEEMKILDYEEHALQSGSNSQAAAYIHLLDVDTGSVTYGVGVSSNITRASVRAIFSAVNRLGIGQK